MQGMRDVLRSSLGRSLGAAADQDRLAAAWTVACGCAMADRGRIVGYQNGVVEIEVADATWLAQMNTLGGVLKREMARISGLPVSEIRFKLQRG